MSLEFQSLAHFAAVAKERAKAVDIATVRFAPNMARGDADIWARTYLNSNPNEEECAFCPNMATCPAARAKLEREVGESFDVIDESADAANDLAAQLNDLETLSDGASDERLDHLMGVIGYLEDFAKAVRAETERRLLAGRDMPSYGLELGRQGNRNWRDPKEVERLVREQFRFKLEDAFDLSLKSPTTFEKMTKGAEPVVSAIRWKKLQAHIVRADAVPSVKPKSRIKNPYSVVKPDAEAFEVVDDLTLQPPVF